MGNIKNFNFNKLDLKLSNSDYWDFFLAVDEGPIPDCNGLTSGSCFVVWYDFNDLNIFPNSATSATSIYSLVTWDGAINTGYTMDTIGLTGIDNGLITFNTLSGDTSNQVLLSALTGSTLVIPSGDTRLLLNRITGTTGNFIYPIEYVIDPTILGNYVNLYGGFYQGYYKLDGNSYEVLPVRVPNAWSTEFWLKPSSSNTGTTGTTLNNIYPDNKGFFFYMGTRAENKFWNEFNGVDSGCTSGCTQPSGCTDTLSPWCTIPKETEISIIGDYGVAIPLSPPQVEIDLVTNGFLIYGRARKNNSNCSCNSCSGPQDNLGNETICSFSGFTSPVEELDPIVDVIDNAIGFRIKDDGSIGYRLLTVTGHCVTSSTGNTYVSGYTVEEAYSISGMVSADTWSYIAIRFVMPYMDECELKIAKPRKGKLMFYVNSKLKFVVNDFDEVIARRLNEYKSKQVGVPFNFSLGGGSQGLLESQTFDGLDIRDRNLPIETNFAGSFIGSISQFKFNICDLSFCDIRYNYITDAPRYSIVDTNLILQEDGYYLLQEDEFGIEWE